VEDEPSRDVLNYVVVMPILIRIGNHTMAGKTIKIQHSFIFTQKGQLVMFSTTGNFSTAGFCSAHLFSVQKQFFALSKGYHCQIVMLAIHT